MLRLQTPEDVERHLKFSVFVRIGVSKIHGIGVIAIRPIPKGIDPFCERELDLEFIAIPDWRIQDNPRIPSGVKELVRDLSSVSEGMRKIPVTGYNSASATFYMNHSAYPNVALDKEGHWVSLRPIRRGEELTIDYDTFCDPTETMFRR